MHFGVEDGTVILHVNMHVCKYAEGVGNHDPGLFPDIIYSWLNLFVLKFKSFDPLFFIIQTGGRGLSLKTVSKLIHK